MVDIEIIRGCRELIKEQRESIARTRSIQVAGAARREQVGAVIDGFFRTDLHYLQSQLETCSQLDEIQSLMKRLLKMTHGKSSRKRYLETFRAIEQLWTEIEIEYLPQCRDLIGIESSNPSNEDANLLHSLKETDEHAACAFRQGLYDLESSTRCSWRGTATEFRESLRLVLDSLARDELVIASENFKLEKGFTKPTMKQKVRFVLRDRGVGGAVRKSIEGATETVESLFAGFVRSVYGQSSQAVHCGCSKNEVASIKRLVSTILHEMLDRGN